MKFGYGSFSEEITVVDMLKYRIEECERRIREYNEEINRAKRTIKEALENIERELLNVKELDEAVVKLKGE